MDHATAYGVHDARKTIPENPVAISITLHIKTLFTTLGGDMGCN
jgi:hypothetical protein